MVQDTHTENIQKINTFRKECYDLPKFVVVVFQLDVSIVDNNRTKVS